MIKNWKCFFTQNIHFAYVLWVYYIAPFVYTHSATIQTINLVIIAAMLWSWKALGEKCILDSVEEEVCDLNKVPRYNSLFAADRMTFSNSTQFGLSYAVFLTTLRLVGYTVPAAVRAFIFIFNQLTLRYFIPLKTLFPCQDRVASF